MVNIYLHKLRNGENLSFKEILLLTLSLAMPSMLSQVSTVVMEYIDSAMVGRLGVNSAASIALVSSTTWLFSGIASAFCLGFSVKIAQCIGAKRKTEANNIAVMGLLSSFLVGIILMIIGVVLAPYLPILLSGAKNIRGNATNYFFIYSISMPFVILVYMLNGILQGLGNMKIPSFINVMMCVIDVVLNFLLIFIFKLNVIGAALATALSHLFACMFLFIYTLKYEKEITLSKQFTFNKTIFNQCLKISLPTIFESIIMSFAYIMSTRIVSPLGTIATATHSFAITVESLCYMPGYGLASAATVLIGQSIGAKRDDLTKKLANILTICGMLIMGFMGIILYLIAPFMMRLLTSNKEVITLGVTILQIEACVESLYGASIVASGVLKGIGDTLATSLMNMFSMWIVRLPLAYYLSLNFQLIGVWYAMAFELCFRGIIFLIRQKKQSFKSYNI